MELDHLMAGLQTLLKVGMGYHTKAAAVELAARMVQESRTAEYLVVAADAVDFAAQKVAVADSSAQRVALVVGRPVRVDLEERHKVAVGPEVGTFDEEVDAVGLGTVGGIVVAT